jgi:magnesium-transporting ATPase (P-type)
VYVKGASELVLKDCTYYLNASGEIVPLTDDVTSAVQYEITRMSRLALRTLCLAHRDFPSEDALPPNWREVRLTAELHYLRELMYLISLEQIPPDSAELVLDGVVGIIDPLRKEVKEAIATAQQAGVDVRMITGDNLLTACAIAKQAGILRDGDVALEGEVFRAMTPQTLDAVLPRLKVLARSSPQDKLLLVQR